jgi:hypothetical protein
MAWIYRPDREIEGEIGQYLLSGQLPERFTSAEYDIAPTTDDRPYPRQVLSTTNDLYRMIGLAGVALAVLVGLALWLWHRKESAERRSIRFSRVVLVFAASSALLVLELIYMHAYQLFLGLPSRSFFFSAQMRDPTTFKREIVEAVARKVNPEYRKQSGASVVGKRPVWTDKTRGRPEVWGGSRQWKRCCY